MGCVGVAVMKGGREVVWGRPSEFFHCYWRRLPLTGQIKMAVNGGAAAPSYPQPTPLDAPHLSLSSLRCLLNHALH